jgi:hypothetical protein
MTKTMTKAEAEFEQTLMEMLTSFVNDPPDTDYQRGYLAALIEVYKNTNWVRDDLLAAAEDSLLRATGRTPIGTVVN